MEFGILIIKILYEKFAHIIEDLEIRGKGTNSPMTSTTITSITLIYFISRIKMYF